MQKMYVSWGFFLCFKVLQVVMVVVLVVLVVFVWSGCRVLRVLFFEVALALGA